MKSYHAFDGAWVLSQKEMVKPFAVPQPSDELPSPSQSEFWVVEQNAWSVPNAPPE